MILTTLPEIPHCVETSQREELGANRVLYEEMPIYLHLYMAYVCCKICKAFTDLPGSAPRLWANNLVKVCPMSKTCARSPMTMTNGLNVSMYFDASFWCASFVRSNPGTKSHLAPRINQLRAQHLPTPDSPPKGSITSTVPTTSGRDTYAHDSDMCTWARPGGGVYMTAVPVTSYEIAQTEIINEDSFPLVLAGFGTFTEESAINHEWICDCRA